MKSPKFLLLIPVVFLAGFGVLYLSKESFLRFSGSGGCGCKDPRLLTGNFEQNERIAFFERNQVSSLLAELPLYEEKVMGVSSADKWIEIDLSEQKLVAWDGGSKYLETPISSGKAWTPTPTGEYNIWAKMKYTKMSGGVKGTSSYYYLPNVPYTMFFYKGYGLHGTYWHNNFGHPMSHGCVNLPTPIAEKLFYWTEPQLPAGKSSVLASREILGTKVVVHQ